jgi:hypothetical protein
MVLYNVMPLVIRHTLHFFLQVGMKDISNEFQQSYGRVCRGGLDVFESADTIETAQRINAMQLLVLLWINGWTSEATAALLIPRPAPVQAAWLGNPSFAATRLVDFLVSGDIINVIAGHLHGLSRRYLLPFRHTSPPDQTRCLLPPISTSVPLRVCFTCL